MGEAEKSNRALQSGIEKVARIVLVVILAMMVISGLHWRMLDSDLRRGILYYNDYKYEKAIEVLNPLLRQPLARFKLRNKAKQTVLLCKAHLAAEERSIEGYVEAILHLESANKIGVPNEEITEALDEYIKLKTKLEAGKKPVVPNKN